MYAADGADLNAEIGVVDAVDAASQRGQRLGALDLGGDQDAEIGDPDGVRPWTLSAALAVPKAADRGPGTPRRGRNAFGRVAEAVRGQ